MREARALALLDHANIVRIFRSGFNAAGNPYYVMESLDGVSLSTELKNGPLTAAHFLEVFSDVMAGLEHAHENKIVHRDLKPSNIIHTRDSQGKRVYKIIDFGIARIDRAAEALSRTLTCAEGLLGSPAYMSPEQCRGQRGDNRSDIYAVGCIMYECLTGQEPFSADNPLVSENWYMTSKRRLIFYWSAWRFCFEQGSLCKPCMISSR